MTQRGGTVEKARLGVAKYQSVYANLRRRIEDGNYPVGGRLPTEDELTVIYGVSRVTMRRSLDILVSEGYLLRRQGSGYSVLTLSPASANCMSSFTDAMLRAGRMPSSQLISLAERTLEPEAMQRLPRRFTNSDPICIERLRLVDSTPEMLVRTWVPRHLVGKTSPSDFPETGSGQSILRILKGRFGVDWGAACEDISAFAATPEIAGHLRIPAGTPILQQVCTAFSEHGNLVFYEQLFRGGVVSFELTGGGRNTALANTPRLAVPV